MKNLRIGIGKNPSHLQIVLTDKTGKEHFRGVLEMASYWLKANCKTELTRKEIVAYLRQILDKPNRACFGYRAKRFCKC